MAGLQRWWKNTRRLCVQQTSFPPEAALIMVFRALRQFTEICTRPCHFLSSGLRVFFVFQLLLLMRACSCTLICRASHPSGISRCVLASVFSLTHVQYAAPLTRKRLFEPGSGSGSHPYRGRTSKDISAELTFVFSELLTCDHNKTHLNAACKQDRSQMERKHQQSTHSHVKHIF